MSRLVTRPAHRLLGRCLSGALGARLTPADLPASDVEWRETVRRASAQYCAPLLRWAFEAQDLRAALPTEVAEFLDAVHVLNLEDNRRYEAQLAHLIRLLNEIDVRPLALKGAAAIIAGLYPTSGERMTCDIDLLVPSPRLPDALDLLMSHGYRPQLDRGELLDPHGLETRSHHYHPLESPDWPVRVELHVQPVILPLVRLLDAEEMTRDVSVADWRGGECLLPSSTCFILHNVIHAFLVDFVCRRRPLSMRQLFEFGHVSRRYGAQIDWRHVVDRLEARGQGDALRQYAGFAELYLRHEPPPQIVIDAASRARVEAYLRRCDQPSSLGEGLAALGHQLRNHARTLIDHPQVVARLLTTSAYARFWSRVRTTTLSHLQ